MSLTQHRCADELRKPIDLADLIALIDPFRQVQTALNFAPQRFDKRRDCKQQFAAHIRIGRSRSREDEGDLSGERRRAKNNLGR